MLKTQRGKQDVTFTAVGYGLQQFNPVFIQSDLIRIVAHPKLHQINVPGFTGDFSMLLSNNHSTGGTCFGDSDGPNYLGASNVIAGVLRRSASTETAPALVASSALTSRDVLDFVDDFMNP